MQESSNSVSPQGPASGIIECLSTLFTHISSSGVLSAVIGHLSQPIGDLYQESIKKTCAKLFNNNFMQKVSTFTCKYIYSVLLTIMPYKLTEVCPYYLFGGWYINFINFIKILNAFMLYHYIFILSQCFH